MEKEFEKLEVNMSTINDCNMTNELILKISISFKAARSKVWDALTNPEQIKKYFFGTETVSDWKKGSSITFRGEWEGKAYEDKGTILDIQKEKILKYNYWSSFSGTKDEPSNYSNIVYLLADENGATSFTIIQDNFKTPEALNNSEKNWRMIFETMKKMLEA